MQTVEKLKKELDLYAELTDLSEVLKGIAAAEFHELQRKKVRFVKFTDAFESFFLTIDFSGVEHPFQQDKTGKLAVIMITSNEGFMGGLNARVINTALAEPGAKTAELIIVGERGAGYLRGLGHTFTDFPGITSEERYEAALRLKDFIMDEGLAGRFGRLILVYPKPVTFSVQTIEILRILPCSELFKRREKTIEKKGDIIIESPLSSIIEHLVGAWITEKLLEVFEDSKLAEFSARTCHLEERHQELERKVKVIRTQYFRSHHELIDKGIRELFAARGRRRK